MNDTLTIPSHKPVANPAKQPDAARYFYSGAAILLFVLMFLGFQQFYLHGKAYPNRPLAPPTRILVISHGTAMLLWMVLFLVQPLLVAANNRKLHMTLGKIGAVLAAAIIGLGMFLSIQNAKFTPPQVKVWGLSAKNFMAVSFWSILVFAAYVAIGVWTRKKPQIHRPMMFMAVLSTMSAPIARIDWMSHWYVGTIWGSLFGPFFMTLVVGLVLFIIKTILTRSFDRYYAIGFAALVAFNWATWAIAPTDAWLNFATALTK
jgi:hypothetical protein